MQACEPTGEDDEEQPADDDEAKEDGDSEGMYKATSTSILWKDGFDGVSDRQLELAAIYAVDLLKCSAASQRLQATINLSRDSRFSEMKLYAKEHEEYRRMLKKIDAEARSKLLSDLQRDPTKILSKLQEWDEDGDGEVSRAEFHSAVPKLGIRAKWVEVDALFRSWDSGASSRHISPHLATSPHISPHLPPPPTFSHLLLPCSRGTQTDRARSLLRSSKLSFAQRPPPPRRPSTATMGITATAAGCLQSPRWRRRAFRRTVWTRASGMRRGSR